MNIDELTVAEVGREADPIFANLFELYMHDMAQWFLFESNNQGRYGYDHVPHWAAGDRFYLAHVGAQPAGFALVGSAALGHYFFGDPKLDLILSVLIGAIPAVMVGAHFSSKASETKCTSSPLLLSV